MYSFEINYGPKIDYRFCTGCGICYEHCPMDIFGWDEEKQMPTVDYPGECSCCCFCEVMCPEVAIDVIIPMHHLLDFGISPKNMVMKSKFLDQKG
jgi:NAD-dependent dihydropyrimidine dehydrogenase PreA subunit